jgi:hypothetical protein
VVQEIVGAGGTSGGVSLVPGAMAAQPHWAIPQAQEVPGASNEIDVFNPGSTSESVTVRFRLPSGPLAPLTQKILPGTTWPIFTSTQTRIPANEPYSTAIDATGGPGVVVSRTVALANTATPPPQAGMVAAVGGLSTDSPSGEWVVPPPGTSDSPAVSGAAPASLALYNSSTTAETYSAAATVASGNKVVATGTVAAGASVSLSGSPLTAAGLNPLVVKASGPLAVSEELAPGAGLGVVSMPGIPLAAAIGS